MTIVVKASEDEVRAAIAEDEAVADLLSSITLRTVEAARPRRSFGLIPGVETVVNIVEAVAGGVAGNAAWALIHQRIYPFLVRRFGGDKVSDAASSPSEENEGREK